MDIEIEYEPIYYSFMLNNQGIYVDHDLDKNNEAFKQGFICTCGNRKEHTIIKDIRSFRQHIKSKCHQEWLNNKNKELPNYYQECLKLNNQINALNQRNQELLYLLEQKESQIQYYENNRNY